jgi:hypothetical protein
LGGTGVGLTITVGVGLAVSFGVGLGVGVGVALVSAACCAGVGVAVGGAVFPLPLAALTREQNTTTAITAVHPRLTCILRVRVLYHCHTPRLLPLVCIVGCGVFASGGWNCPGCEMDWERG